MLELSLLKDVDVNDVKKEIKENAETLYAEIGLKFDEKSLEKEISRSSELPVDAVIEFTGEIDLFRQVKNKDEKVTATYPAAKTTSGTWLAVRHLLEDWNVSRFAKNGEELISERIKEGTSTKETIKFTTKVSDHIDSEKAIISDCTNVLIFASLLKKSNSLAGVRVRKVFDGYLQFEAKSDSDSKSFEKYKKGFKRCIRKQLWQVEE